MKILIFNPERKSCIAKRLREMRPLQGYEILDTVNRSDFLYGYSQCYSGESIVVYFAGELEDMEFLREVSMTFVDVKLVIHLIKDTDDLYKRALEFCPRLISTEPGNKFMLLTNVIERLVKERVRIIS